MKFDIESWADSNLTKAHRTSTGQINSECPWCGGDRFYLAVEGDRAGKYICHQCDQKGRNPVGLIAHVEGLSKSEAMRRMVHEAGVFRRREQTPQTLLEVIRGARDGADVVEDQPVDFGMPKGFVPVYSEKSKKWRFPAYLKERGVKRATAQAWGLGYCARGKYAGRLVIPLVCPNGRSWTARDMTGKQQPKYINPPGADHSRLLFGWEHARITADAAVVEGPLDALKAWQTNIPAYGLGGKNLSPEQASLLFMKPKDCSIVVMLDPEELVAPYAVAEKLIVHFDNVYIAFLNPGSDPGNAKPSQLVHAYDHPVRYEGRTNRKLIGLLDAAKQRIGKFPQW